MNIEQRRAGGNGDDQGAEENGHRSADRGRPQQEKRGGQGGDEQT